MSRDAVTWGITALVVLVGFDSTGNGMADLLLVLALCMVGWGGGNLLYSAFSSKQ